MWPKLDVSRERPSNLLDAPFCQKRLRLALQDISVCGGNLKSNEMTVVLAEAFFDTEPAFADLGCSNMLWQNWIAAHA